MAVGGGVDYQNILGSVPPVISLLLTYFHFNVLSWKLQKWVIFKAQA